MEVHGGQGSKIVIGRVIPAPGIPGKEPVFQLPTKPLSSVHQCQKCSVLQDRLDHFQAEIRAVVGMLLDTKPDSERKGFRSRGVKQARERLERLVPGLSTGQKSNG